MQDYIRRLVRRGDGYEVRKKIIGAVLKNITKMPFYESLNYMLSEKIFQNIEKT